MNQPKDRVTNKVNKLFGALTQLIRTVEVNRDRLEPEDLQKIKDAVMTKTAEALERIDESADKFKLN